MRCVLSLSLLLKVLCPVSAQIYQVNGKNKNPVVLGQAVTFSGLPLDISQVIGTYGNLVIAIVGDTNTCKASLYKVDMSTLKAISLIADGDPKLNGECGFGQVQIRKGVLYFATDNPQIEYSWTDWKYDIDTGVLTRLVGSTDILAVKKQDGTVITGIAAFASLALPSYDGSQLWIEVEMAPSRAVALILFFNYVGLIRLDSPTSVHPEVIPNMVNFAIGGLPAGILEPQYGFSSDALGGVNVIERDSNNSSPNISVVHYNANGGYSVPMRVGYPDNNGKSVTSWTSGNSILLDSFSRDFLFNYNTSDGSYEVRLDGATFAPILRSDLPSGTSHAIVTFSNNVPCSYAKFFDTSNQLSDGLVCPNGDIRQFNFNEHLPDGSFPAFTNGDSHPNGCGAIVHAVDQNSRVTQWWLFTVPCAVTVPTQALAGSTVMIAGHNLTASDGSLATTLVDVSTNQLISNCTGTSEQVLCTVPIYGGNYSLTINVGNVPSSPFTLSVSGPAAPPLPLVVGMFNGASFAGSITAGSTFTAQVKNLGLSAPITAALPGSTKLGGVSIAICGSPAYLTYVGSDVISQINGIVPLAAGGQVSCPVVATVNGASSVQFIAQVHENPSEFLYSVADPSGAVDRIPIVTTQDGTWFVSSALGMLMPANIPTTSNVPAGTILTFWLTGIDGPTIPDVSDGQLTPLLPVPFPVTPTIKIGGVPATVLYAGLAPGLTGVQQINVVAPFNLIGNEPVSIQTAEGTSAVLSPAQN